MTTTDPVLDSDLDAYVDDQLPAARRIEVETYLAENPSKAAKVMADLGIRGELRLALAMEREAAGRPETREAARRLEQALSRGQLFSNLRRAAAIVVLIGAGWVGSSYLGSIGISEVAASPPPPPYVEEALAAHRTEQLRATMPSQAEAASFDREDIRAKTGIVLPVLPRNWKVADAQIFPSGTGPSVELSILGDDQQRLSLFAVRPGHFAVQTVSHHSGGDFDAAYWQIGEVAYALISAERQERLDSAAGQLAKTLY